MFLLFSSLFYEKKRLLHKRSERFLHALILPMRQITRAIDREKKKKVKKLLCLFWCGLLLHKGNGNFGINMNMKERAQRLMHSSVVKSFYSL